MKKLIAYVLCCSVLLLSWPNFALANDNAKTEFINNYMHYLDNSIKYQKASMENMLSNNMNVKIDVNLSDGSMLMDDGTTVSNVNGSGRIETVSSFKDSIAQADFEMNLPSMPELKGRLYLTPEEIILTSETVKALAEAGIDFPGLEVDEPLPSYVVYTNFISESEMSLFKEAFSNESLMGAYGKTDEIKTFMEILLQIIPESCFSYGNGYAVLELEPSILTSAALINNLKANSEELAVSFTEIMSKPADMSEEEFNSMKSELVTGFMEMIDSIQVKDLPEMDLPFSIEEFKVSTKDQLIETSIHVKVDENGETFDLEYNGSYKSEANSLTGEADMLISLDTSFAVMDFSLQVNSKNNTDKSAANMIITGNIKDDSEPISGVIAIDFTCDYKYDNAINMPAVYEGNSIMIDWAQYQASTTEYPGTDGNETGIQVYIDGWEMYFDQAQPLIMNDRTMLPLRDLAEGLGCEIVWLPPDTVILSDGIHEDMTLTINAQSYQVGDEFFPCDVPPQIINDYTYVPVRLIAEYFGFTAEWDELNKALLLMSN